MLRIDCFLRESSSCSKQLSNHQIPGMISGRQPGRQLCPDRWKLMWGLRAQDVGSKLAVFPVLCDIMWLPDPLNGADDGSLATRQYESWPSLKRA